MKRILIITLLMMLIAPALALPDVYDQLRGKQMVGDKGAPWFADDASMKFGTGKDVAIAYDDAMDTFYINDTPTYLEEGVTFGQTVTYSVNATTTLNTVLTSANTKTVYPMDGSGGSVTLTLPDPTTVTGRLYIIAVAADMAANNIVVADTGSGKIGGAGGADTLTSTDATAALAVISNGTHYLVISKIGTWS